MTTDSRRASILIAFAITEAIRLRSTHAALQTVVNLLGNTNTSGSTSGLKHPSLSKIESSATRLQSIDTGLLAELFDLSPDVAFFVKDRDGRYVFVNNSLVARHGLKSRSDVVGKRPSEISPGISDRFRLSRIQRCSRREDHSLIIWKCNGTDPMLLSGV